MRALDERFLTVHPRTRLWWIEREQCLRCAHVEHSPVGSTGGGGGMNCKAVSGGGGPKAHATCILAREAGGNRCGPDAALFKRA